VSEGKTLPTSPSKKSTKKEQIIKYHLNSHQMTASELTRKPSKVERARYGRMRVLVILPNQRI